MSTVFTSIRKQLLWTKPLWCVYLGLVSSSCLPLPRTAIHHSHSGGMVAGEWCAVQSLTEAAQHRCAENAPLANLAALLRLCFFFFFLTHRILCALAQVSEIVRKSPTQKEVSAVTILMQMCEMEELEYVHTFIHVMSKFILLYLSTWDLDQGFVWQPVKCEL